MWRVYFDMMWCCCIRLYIRCQLTAPAQLQVSGDSAGEQGMVISKRYANGANGLRVLKALFGYLTHTRDRTYTRLKDDKERQRMTPCPRFQHEVRV
jgi:hypothetical protein